MKHLSKLTLAIVLGLAATSFVSANEAHHANGSTPEAQASAPLSDGEVRKIDKNTGKITIKHGSLAKLEMPGMTMAFRVSDPKMLDRVQVGDKIKFEADKINGALTVMKLETAR